MITIIVTAKTQLGIASEEEGDGEYQQQVDADENSAATARRQEEVQQALR